MSTTNCFELNSSHSCHNLCINFIPIRVIMRVTHTYIYVYISHAITIRNTCELHKDVYEDLPYGTKNPPFSIIWAKTLDFIKVNNITNKSLSCIFLWLKSVCAYSNSLRSLAKFLRSFQMQIYLPKCPSEMEEGRGDTFQWSEREGSKGQRHEWNKMSEGTQIQIYITVNFYNLNIMY